MACPSQFAEASIGWLGVSSVQGKPLTERAYLLLSRELERIRQAGHDPNDALDLAIERGWDTVKLDWLVNGRQRAGPVKDEFDEKYGADGIAGIMREARRG